MIKLPARRSIHQAGQRMQPCRSAAKDKTGKDD